MGDMNKLCRVIEEELQKIAEKGLNTGNLETAYKLIDMYKDLKNTEYWDVKADYYMSMLGGEYSGNDSYSDTNYSGRRGQKRDSMGRYSREGGMNSYNNGLSYAGRGGNRYSGRANNWDGGYSGNIGHSERYGEYMDSKQSYRSSKSPECKQRLMETLEEYMEDFSAQMEEMLRDSDCAEERTTIKRYLDKIKNIA